MQSLKVALAGNPNSGKTTLFNAITGARQHVGNYPGITVEHKTGETSVDHEKVHVVDLPGCYSLTAYSPEELVSRKIILEEKPDVVVHVVDATNLERSLYLTVQLMELGVPVVVALNMMDAVKRQGMHIDTTGLSKSLGVPVVETVAREGKGKIELMREAIRYARQQSDNHGKPLEISYGSDLDLALKDLIAIFDSNNTVVDNASSRWTALKYLEGDSELMARLKSQDSRDNALFADLEKRATILRRHCKDTLDTGPETIIADYRYGFIAGMLRSGILKQDEQVQRVAISEKMDRVLTHRVIGPLIMLGVVYALFWATFTLSEAPAGWLEAFFGWLSSTAETTLPEGLLSSLVVSGIIDGVGGVLGFAPLIAVMFLGLTFLEDMGYMARMAYMLDRVMRVFGLHGCSVMPLLISGGIPGGCAVPGVMATRTLRSPAEKLATVLTAPFMACGAKIPVIVLLAAAFFPENETTVMFGTTLPPGPRP